MVEYLIDRAANNKTETKTEKTNERIISDLLIENGYIKVRGISDDKWDKLVEIDDIVNKDLDSIIEDYKEDNKLILSDSISRKLEEIVTSVKSAWDYDAEKFKLDYNENKNGQMHQLYVPFNSQYMDNACVRTIYNKEGEFVAQELEDNMSEELYKLESYDLYVDNPFISNPKIYKKYRVTSKEAWNNNYKYISMDEKDSKKDIIEMFTLSSVVTFVPVVPYILTGEIFLSILIMLLLMIHFLYVICLFLTIRIPLGLIYTIYKSYRDSGTDSYKPIVS